MVVLDLGAVVSSAVKLRRAYVKIEGKEKNLKNWEWQQMVMFCDKIDGKKYNI